MTDCNCVIQWEERQTKKSLRWWSLCRRKKCIVGSIHNCGRTNMDGFQATAVIYSYQGFLCSCGSTHRLRLTTGFFSYHYWSLNPKSQPEPVKPPSLHPRKSTTTWPLKPPLRCHPVFICTHILFNHWYIRHGICFPQNSLTKIKAGMGGWKGQIVSSYKSADSRLLAGCNIFSSA